MRTLGLNTVCESARCPNMGECWEHRTATFMILGNICTRACGFCAVPSGKPAAPPDEQEPERVAEAVERMGLRYAVVTSVNRDDQPDGGAAIFARTIAEIRGRIPDCKVEVLIPDFRGRLAGARNRDCRAPGCSEPQHGNGSAAVSRSAQGRDLRAVARASAPREISGAGDAHENRIDAGSRRNARGSARGDAGSCRARHEHPDSGAIHAADARTSCPSCASFIPMNSPNTRRWASKWVSRTSNRALWCVLRITRSSRKPPRTFK